MTQLVGYLTKRPDGLYGSRGTAYDYVTAGNGVLLEAENEYLAARIQVAEGLVRGLAPLNQRIVLKRGRIPGRLWELAVDIFLADSDKEKLVVIRWENGEYRLSMPEQVGTAGGIDYKPPADAVIELHSHGPLRAFFSTTDDNDEQGFRLYGVAGLLRNERPQFTIRLGVYGYFLRILWDYVFDGPQPVDIDELQEGAEA